MRKYRRLSKRRPLGVLWSIFAAVFALTAVVLVRLAPAKDERPLVTVFMKPDCESCRRWMRHLDARGFYTQVATEDEWIAAGIEPKVPPGFNASHRAIVDGLFIEGYVPARDIHRALTSPERDSIRGLVLPGAPPGAPGVEAALKQPYVVFSMDAHGLLRPWVTHNHLVH